MSDDFGDLTDEALGDLFRDDRDLAEEFLRQLNEISEDLLHEAIYAMTDDMHERHELYSRALGS